MELPYKMSIQARPSNYLPKKTNQINPLQHNINTLFNHLDPNNTFNLNSLNLNSSLQALGTKTITSLLQEGTKKKSEILNLLLKKLIKQNS